jgi:hypothetical protein
MFTCSLACLLACLRHYRTELCKDDSRCRRVRSIALFYSLLALLLVPVARLMGVFVCVGRFSPPPPPQPPPLSFSVRVTIWYSFYVQRSQRINTVLVCMHACMHAERDASGARAGGRKLQVPCLRALRTIVLNKVIFQPMYVLRTVLHFSSYSRDRLLLCEPIFTASTGI